MMRATQMRTRSHSKLLVREADRAWRATSHKLKHGSPRPRAPEVRGAVQREIRVHNFPITTSVEIFPKANLRLLS